MPLSDPKSTEMYSILFNFFSAPYNTSGSNPSASTLNSFIFSGISIVSNLTQSISMKLSLPK